MTYLSIDHVAKKIHEMPALSPAAMELLDSIDRENVETDLIVKKISLDVALVTKTLRLANSSFYGLSHKVGSIAEAVAILGFQNIRILATAMLVINNFPKQSQFPISIDEFWSSSIATAICAKYLAKLMRINQENAFTCGLLHDIGKLGLALQFEKEYATVLEYVHTHECRDHVAELAVLGIDHATTGAFLAAHWKFPVELQECIRDHHSPCSESTAALSAVIIAADDCGRALISKEKFIAADMDTQVFKKLHLSEDTYEQIIHESSLQLDEIRQILFN